MSIDGALFAETNTSSESPARCRGNVTDSEVVDEDPDVSEARTHGNAVGRTAMVNDTMPLEDCVENAAGSSVAARASLYVVVVLTPPDVLAARCPPSVYPLGAVGLL